jgi:hypothetical protein
VKGKSALALSRDLGLSYKAAFVLLHKLREAMAAELKGRVVGSEGKVAEVDGGHFGGYVRPANIRENRRDRRYAENQTGKRKAVVVIRERGGATVPAVFKTEGQAIRFIQARIRPGTIVNADESPARNALHGRFEMRRINHQEAYSLDGACTNQAEEFFSRMRRAEASLAAAFLFSRILPPMSAWSRTSWPSAGLLGLGSKALGMSPELGVDRLAGDSNRVAFAP